TADFREQPRVAPVTADIRVIRQIAHVSPQPRGNRQAIGAAQRNDCHWRKVDGVEATCLSTLPAIGFVDYTGLSPDSDAACQGGGWRHVEKLRLEIDVAKRRGSRAEVPEHPLGVAEVQAFFPTVW